MPGRILLAGVLSAVVLFFWGFLYWAMLLGPDRMAHRLNDTEAAAVTAVLKHVFTESGAYMYPMQPRDQSDQALMSEFTRRHQEGPVFLMFYKTNGGDPMDPLSMAQGFFHMLACTLLAGIFLSTVLPAMCCYAARAAFVTGLGLFGEIWVELGKPIWFHQPWSFALFSVLYGAVGWLLVGLIIGAIVKSPGAAKEK